MPERVRRFNAEQATLLAYSVVQGVTLPPPPSADGGLSGLRHGADGGRALLRAVRAGDDSESPAVDQAEGEDSEHDEADDGVERVALAGEADDGEDDARDRRGDQNQQTERDDAGAAAIAQ